MRTEETATMPLYVRFAGQAYLAVLIGSVIATLLLAILAGELGVPFELVPASVTSILAASSAVMLSVVTRIRGRVPVFARSTVAGLLAVLMISVGEGMNLSPLAASLISTGFAGIALSDLAFLLVIARHLRKAR